VRLHAGSIDFEEIMSFTNWFTVAVLALLPLAVNAQQKQQRPDPSDANAPIPASGYESVFRNYKAAATGQESPDKTWRAANREVEKLGGHAGHMKEVPGEHGKHHQGEGK
jgi:hypothetical protein